MQRAEDVLSNRYTGSLPLFPFLATTPAREASISFCGLKFLVSVPPFFPPLIPFSLYAVLSYSIQAPICHFYARFKCSKVSL